MTKIDLVWYDNNHTPPRQNYSGTLNVTFNEDGSVTIEYECDDGYYGFNKTIHPSDPDKLLKGWWRDDQTS